MKQFILIAGLLFMPVIGLAQDADEQESFEAIINSMTPVLCSDGSSDCTDVLLTGTSGSFDGESFTVQITPLDTLGGRSPTYETGDRVIVQTQIISGARQYFLSDLVRRGPLLWLVVAFILSVWLFGGLRALRSFVGMAVSLGILFAFILPRILAGDSPALIAFVGSVIIMIVTFALSHGWNKKSIAALIGTCASLLLTVILAWLVSSYAKLTGTADEEIFFLLADYPALNTSGILLAAIIIGTLGVLDDVTIAQSSAVFELRGANPRWNARQLYKSALRIGADHIAAAVNTLILAYAGTALPLLLLLVGVQSGESVWMFLNREAIATEIARTLVGSIGLLAAVPLTTWIAASLAVRTDVSNIDDNRVHHH